MAAVITEAIRAESDAVQGIGSDYEIKYGFHVPEDYFFKSGRGLSHELVDAISSHKSEPDWMRKSRHRSLDYFNARPLPTWGGDVSDDRLREHLLLHPADREAGELVGGATGRHQGHLGPAGHPGGGEEVPRRRRRPVRVRGRLPQAPRGSRPSRACSSWTWTRVCASTKRSCKSVLREDHPAERQQVRRPQLGGLVGRLVHLRAAGRARSSCRSRPTSGSTRRTWASSSGR